MKTARLIRILIVLSFVLAIAQRGQAAPSTRPAASRPTTRPGNRRAQRQRLLELTRKSIQFLEAGKRAEAEAALAEALIIAPHNSLNLYNMACVKALTGHGDAAIDYLERSAREGFTDFLHIEQDPDLTSLRQLPRFKAFLGRKAEFQKLAAQRVVEWLKSQFGNGYLFEIDEQDKLIFATNTDQPTLDALKKSLVKQARSQWKDLFEHKPDQYISVVVPSARDYREIVPQRGVGGFYNHDERILIAQRLGLVIMHEFTHALHNADLDPLGQEHPIWLMEGLATMYEGAHFEGEKLIPGDTFRLRSLQLAGRDGRLLKLEEIMKMDQKTFVKKATLAYAQSGSVMLYLYDQGLLRKFYDTYKAGYAQEKTGKAAIEKVTGKTLAQFEQDWKTWMMHRTPPPLSTGMHGVVMGVTFSDANDGLRISTMVPNGPAAKAGAKVGDVLVGIDGQEVRDQEVLMAALSARHPGDQVTIRLRRGAEYHDLGVTLVKRDEIAGKPMILPDSKR